jgi:hypothetical protein
LSRLPDEFHQDRALRDAARGVLAADIEHAREALSGKAIAGRVAGRVGDGARDVIEVAKQHAGDKSGLFAGLVAAIVLWFARKPIAGAIRSVLDDLLDEETGSDATDENDTPENGANAEPDGASPLDVKESAAEEDEVAPASPFEPSKAEPFKSEP